MIAIFSNDELFQFAVANEREHAARTLAELMEMDALRARFKDDAYLEGRRLNREAYIDGKREAEAMDRNREP